MPATGLRPRPAPPQRLRLTVGALALAFLCSLGLAATPPVEATNWSRQIAAARGGQIAYESAMRAADQELRRLKHARTQAQRRLKKAVRRRDRAIERRAAKKRAMLATRAQVRVARAALATARMETPPPPDAARAILTLTQAQAGMDAAASPDTAMLITGVTTDELGFVDAAIPVPASAVRSAGRPDATVPADVSVADVVRLERTLRRDQRAFRKARRQVQRSVRNVRLRRSAVVSIRARQRSASARRNGAEAALASRILAMSGLAQRRAAKKTNVRPGVNGGFTWPARGRISQSYGCTGFRLNPARGSCRHFHDGIDIVASRGSPVRAAAVGVVSYIGWNPWDQQARAFIVVVAHPGGYETVYGHVLPTRRVRVGQLVHRGEVIGYMGNTGRSTGVHLHFELRRGRTTVNPLAFL